MAVKILDIVDKCYSSSDGQKVFLFINDYIKRNEQLTISFESVDAIPSSFVNSAFIQLLEYHDFQKIKDCLYFSNSTPQINEMIKKRFMFELSNKKN